MPGSIPVTEHLAVYKLFFLFFLVLAGSTPLWAAGRADGLLALSEPEVPRHDVRYKPGAELPRWKRDWDRARELYHAGQVEQSLVQYELLLQEKGSIDEARWEYTVLLMREKRWDDAARQLERLLERQPGNRDFLLAKARVALEGGNPKEAVRLYGQVYQEDPAGPGGLAALTGLVRALGQVGNREAQLLLLDQLMIRVPDDRSLLTLAGQTAYDLGRFDKAGQLFERVLRLDEKNRDALRFLARIKSRQERLHQAAIYWQRLVALLPDDREANQWLVSYYRDEKSPAMALVHVERLLSKEPSSRKLLLTAARLQRAAGHPGRALDYYCLYLDLVPSDSRVMAEREQLRAELARNLLSLAENGGAVQLWEDLARLTRDREGVYRSMADLLGRQHKEKERDDLLKVLARRQKASDRPASLPGNPSGKGGGSSGPATGEHDPVRH